MDTEIAVDTSSSVPHDEQETIAVTTTPTLPDTSSSPPSIQTLVKELLSVLENQEAALFAIAGDDVNEKALDPLTRAKAGNKEALVKLADILEAVKYIHMDSTSQQNEKPVPEPSFNHSMSALPISPILPRLSESKQSPPGSPSKYFGTLSFSKNKRFSLGGASKSADNSLEENSNPLSMSMGGAETTRVRSKKEGRRSITQFLTLKPTRSATASMAHSTSTPTLATTVRAEIIPSYALDPNIEARYVREC